MRLEWLRLKFRMELAANEMRMISQFYHFDISAIRCRSRNAQAGRRHRLFVFPIEFITMAMPLADFTLFVNAKCQCVGLDLASPCAQAHCAAEFFHPPQLTQLVNHTMRRCGVEFTGISLSQTNYIARKFNTRCLHSQANAEVRHLVLTCIADRDQHTLNTAFAEPTRNENSVVAFE